jgi:hypothetical protein
MGGVVVVFFLTDNNTTPTKVIYSHEYLCGLHKVFFRGGIGKFIQEGLF